MRTFEHLVQTNDGQTVTVVLGNPTIASIAHFFDVPEDAVSILEDNDGEEYVIVSGRGMGTIVVRN